MATRSSRLISALVLLAVSWQGPTPCLHCHETRVRATDQPFSWLAAHLQASHPGTGELDDEFLGWHLHFGLPNGDPTVPSPTEQSRIPSSASANVLRAIGEASRDVESRIVCFSPRVVSSRAPWIEWRALGLANRTFFENFAADLPLPLRFGILRV